MRILGIMALCLVLIAGLIFGYDRRNEVLDRVSDRFEGVLLDNVAVVDATPDQLPDSAPAEGLLIIPMREAGKLNVMVGFPSFARATFDMPVSSAARSGEIVLEIAGALQDEAEGLLWVSVNGARKTAQVIDSGDVHRKLIVALNTRDLAADRLSVSMALEGRTPAIECTADWDGGVSLQVLPSSHLRLNMVGPVEDPVDLLRLGGTRPTLEWPTGDAALRARRFVQAYDLGRRMDDVMFATETGTTLDVSDDVLDGVIAATTPTVELEDLDPSNLAATLGTQRSREFEGQTRWRMTFERGDFDQAIKALRLDLLLVSVTAPNEPWLMVAELNDRLLASRPLAPSDDAIGVTMPVSQDLLLDQNVLTVSLRNTSESDSRCPKGVPAVAEVTTLSVMTDGPQQHSALDALARDITAPLAVSVDDASGPLEAQIALDTITAFVERTKPVSLVTTSPTADPNLSVLVIARDGVTEALSVLEHGRHWLMYQTDEDGSLHVIQITASTEVETQSLPRAVLIVSSAAGVSN